MVRGSDSAQESVDAEKRSVFSALDGHSLVILVLALKESCFLAKMDSPEDFFEDKGPCNLASSQIITIERKIEARSSHPYSSLLMKRKW